MLATFSRPTNPVQPISQSSNFSRLSIVVRNARRPSSNGQERLPRDVMKKTYRELTEMLQPVAFHVVMLSSLALLVLAQGRVLCGASGPVDGEDRSVAIPLKTKGGGCLVY